MIVMMRIRSVFLWVPPKRSEIQTCLQELVCGRSEREQKKQERRRKDQQHWGLCFGQWAQFLWDCPRMPPRIVPINDRRKIGAFVHWFLPFVL
jgi:hypothetical protein